MTTATEVPFPVQDDENFNFLGGLYPTGVDLKELLNFTKENLNISDQATSSLVQGQLSFHESEKMITKINTDNNSMRIILTDKGKQYVWKYMEKKLWKENKARYFAFLRKWVKSGDRYAVFFYKKKSMELFLECPEIASMLIIPHYEYDIIEHYARVAEKPVEKELVAYASEYLGNLMGVGFVISKDKPSPDGLKTVYFLNKEGRMAMGAMFNRVKEMMKKGETGNGDTSPKKGKKKFFRSFWFMFLVSAIAGVTLASLIGISVSRMYGLEDLASLVILSSTLPPIILFAQWMFWYFIDSKSN